MCTFIVQFIKKIKEKRMCQNKVLDNLLHHKNLEYFLTYFLPCKSYLVRSQDSGLFLLTLSLHCNIIHYFFDILRQYHTLSINIIKNHTTLFNIIQHQRKFYYIIQHHTNSSKLYNNIQHHTKFYFIVQHHKTT